MGSSLKKKIKKKSEDSKAAAFLQAASSHASLEKPETATSYSPFDIRNLQKHSGLGFGSPAHAESYLQS